MKELHLVIHFPALFRFYLFAALRSLAWGLAAFFLFLLPDLLLLFIHAAPLASWSLALSSHWIAAFLAIAGFEVFYGLLRLLSIPASYFQKLAQYLLPGLILFSLLGGSLLELLGSQNQFLHVSLVILILVAGILLAWRWPDFERANLIFLLGAAFVSHYFSKFIFLLDGREAGLQSLFARTLLHFVLTGLLYINLHIRYRLQLAQGWEPVWIPRSYPKIAIGLLALLLGFSLLSSLGAGFLWPELPSVWRYFLALAAVLLLRWLLLLRQATAPLNKSLRQILMQVQTTSLLLFAFAFFCLPGLYFLARPSASAIAYLQRLQTRSALQIALAGRILDSDGDGNSLWPGKDPDDHDACTRLDIKNICNNSKESLLESNTKIELSSHGEIRVPRRMPKRSLVLITIEGPPGSAAKPKYFLLANPRPWKKFLVPSDAPSLALWALFYRRSAFLSNPHRQEGGLFSLFGSFGYRTFCYSNKTPQAAIQHACQIELEGKNHSELYHNFQKYKEEKNFVHLHFQWEKMPAGRFPRNIERERLRWSRAGSVVILLLQKQSPVAYVSSSHGILRRQQSGFLDLADVLLQNAGWQESRLAPQQIVGSLSFSPFRDKFLWEGSKKDSLQFFAGKQASFLENTVSSLSAKESTAKSKQTSMGANAETARLTTQDAQLDLVQEAPLREKQNRLPRLPRYTYRFAVRAKQPQVIYFDAITGAEQAIPFADLE